MVSVIIEACEELTTNIRKYFNLMKEQKVIDSWQLAAVNRLCNQQMTQVFNY